MKIINYEMTVISTIYSFLYSLLNWTDNNWLCPYIENHIRKKLTEESTTLPESFLKPALVSIPDTDGQIRISWASNVV